MLSSQLRIATLLTAALAACIIMFGEPAMAYKQFLDRWQEVYLEGHPDEEYIEMCRKQAKCHVCHQGRKRSRTNTYGADAIIASGKLPGSELTELQKEPSDEDE